MNTTTTKSGKFEAFVRERFGALSAGAHEQDEGKACVLEAAAAWRGLAWTDDPDDLDAPDIRPLNDAPWPSDEERTEQMIRLYEAVADWAEWSGKRRKLFTERVALRTAREILSEALRACGLEGEAARLARASTLAEAHAAAHAAMASAKRAAERAADASAAALAARAAHAAAYVAGALSSVARANAYTACYDAAEASRRCAGHADSAAVGLLRTAVEIWVEAAHEGKR